MSPYCTNCGNEVEDSWNICPNCGKTLKERQAPLVQPQQQIRQQSQPYQTTTYQRSFTRVGNSYGTTALICGLLGIFFGIFYIAIFLGIIAMIMGGIGVGRDENPSLATIGLVLGIIDFVLFIIFFFFLFSWWNWMWNWWP
ncbi:MAG: zinc-ribbon domain-containing protein [Promethearchaeota archaeon]|nr:MAG: zinc-ribbon domain-containing protein [Candidatus Lokiarchaeota archaeon]